MATPAPAPLIIEGGQSSGPAEAASAPVPADEDTTDEGDQANQGNALVGVATTTLEQPSGTPAGDVLINTSAAPAPDVEDSACDGQGAALVEGATSEATTELPTGNHVGAMTNQEDATAPSCPAGESPAATDTAARVDSTVPEPDASIAVAPVQTSSCSQSAAAVSEEANGEVSTIDTTRQETPQHGAEASAIDTQTPTPGEAARRLTHYTAEVQQKRRSPLISSPPKQKPAARRPQVQTRSARLAAQPLAHVPALKRGEVLLMQKLGIQPPPAPSTPATKRALEAIISDKLSDEQVAMLDLVFPAANYKAGRATRRPPLVVA